jgi:hypothetical protein
MSAGVPQRRADLPPAAAHLHPTAVAVFEALNRAGVRWCLLRGEARLDAPPHDVDLLVAEDDFKAMTEAVRPLGFVPVPTWARATHRFLVAQDAAAPEWFLLDAVTALSYGPAYAIQTGAAEACLSRRERVGPLWLLCADDAFWTLLLHCLLNRGDVPAHQDKRLRRLAAAARADSSLAGFTAGLCPPGWDAERILATVQAEGAVPVVPIAPALIRRWANRRPLRFGLRRLADKARWRLAPLHKLIAMRGLRVVLLDEAGDLAQPLAAGLPDEFYLPTKVLHVRSHQTGAGARAAWQGLLRRVRDEVLATYHQGRGRLVVIPVRGGLRAARDDRSPAWPPSRPHVVILLVREATAVRAPREPASPAVVTCTVRLDDENLSRARGFVLHAIWQAYARERGWGPTHVADNDRAPIASSARPSDR